MLVVVIDGVCDGESMFFCVDVVDAGLKEGVSDSGLHAFAQAGCGANLTSLHLSGETLCVFLFNGETVVMMDCCVWM